MITVASSSSFSKWIVSFLVGTLWSALIEPIIPMVLVCIFAMIADTVTAWRLSRRCHKKYPKVADGKVHSSKIFNIFGDFVVLFTAILLAHMIDEVILKDFDSMYLPNWIATVYCAYQLISIIENESSCNDKSWARLAQRVVANKISRHLDIDEYELNELLRKEGRGHGHPHQPHRPRPHHEGRRQEPYREDDYAAPEPDCEADYTAPEPEPENEENNDKI